MAQVIIKHPDGRRYEVSESAFSELYEPFGFAVEGVVFNGAMVPATEANLAKANEGASASVNETELTAETRERAVILSDMEAAARAKLSSETPVSSSAKSDGSKTSDSGKTAKTEG